jgi:SAM-dependent methyltransferase
MDLDAFREQSLQTWDSMAAGWETRHAFLERNMGHLTELIIERISPAAGQVILEVGAGPGDLGHRIAGLVGPDGRVISTDFSSEMMDVARRSGMSRGLGNVEYRQLDAEAMDLEDDTVDAVVGRAVFMLLGDPAAALGEARRVLRPGGSQSFTVFTTPNQNPWFAVPAGVLIQQGHLAPAQPGAPGVFALGDPERVRALVNGAGFSEPLTEQVDFVFNYSDEHDAWNAIVDLNGPLAVVIKRLSADERDAVRHAVLDGFEPFRDTDGSYQVRAQALAIHAE